MNGFWEIVASNSLVVVVLAAGVGLLGRFWKNPAGLHLLWMLVLVKLVTPPLVTLPVALPTQEPLAASGRNGAGRYIAIELPTEISRDEIPSAAFEAPEGRRMDKRPLAETPAAAAEVAVPGSAQPGVDWPNVLVWSWVAGIVLLSVGRACRILRFQRLLRTSETASPAVLAAAETIGERLGLRRIPQIAVLPLRLSPLVWSIGGRPRVLLPGALFERLDVEAQEAILAHELAHVRRRDHWVRLLELAISTLFWWHPVVWWACRQLRELEEQCCDALVLSTVPHGPRAYATALVDTLDFLSEHSVGAPLVATAASSPASLARRIKMLKSHASVVRLTLGRLAVLSAIVALPMAIAFAAKPPQADGPSRSGEQKSGAQRAVQKRMVNRRVRDFPEKTDLSAPESALAAYARRLARKDIMAGQELSWTKFDPEIARDVEDALKHDPNAPKDLDRQILDAEIIEVLTYRNNLAVVICKQSESGKHTYSGMLMGRIQGVWKCSSPGLVGTPGPFPTSSAEAIAKAFESKKEELWKQFAEIRKDVVHGRTPMVSAKDVLTSRAAVKSETTPGQKAASAADQERKRWERTTWRMNIGLDVPGLRPQAVQWAIFDEDPVPGFQARVERMQSYYRKRIEEATDANAKEMQRSIGMSVSWDLGFKKITGDRLHLLTSGGSHTISSNGPDGKKWIVTKTVRIDAKPACWCIPVEVKTGQSIDVWLDEDNLFDLNAAFNEALWAPDPAE